mmetsp:Transcript_21840/g.39188  ORF Transcript_21840/g.39188 Transcript_21840/m.39188 type:complete len:94 (-) Transcript_21840:210-491(-)
MRQLKVILSIFFTAAAKECHPMDAEHPKPLDYMNCHRECNALTEWCVPNNSSSTGWACDKRHHRGESQPGQHCVPGGGAVFLQQLHRGLLLPE